VWFDYRMELRRSDDVQPFLAAAGAFLGEREAAHNLIFGICSSLAADASMSAGPPYFATIHDADRVVAATLRTPPWNLVLSEVDDLSALDAIVDDLASGPAASELPGVVGPDDMVEVFAHRWTARTGRPGRVALKERIFQLTTVRPPRPVPGHMRVATQGDRDLLIRWLIDFEADALAESPSPGDPATSVDRWLSGAGGRIDYLWEDGEERSWCGVGGLTPHGIRVGPVFTPRAWRGKGYASALVAEASQAQLDAGRQFCFLYTDLANPTSNHIYAEIGYEPVRDACVVTFD
jgi:predicted GNAT family acetyltransferase